MSAPQTRGGELVYEGRVAMACPIERAALRDARLSWAARGLFAFLWDLPEGWRPCLTHLASMGIDGTYATRSALAELEAVGAIRIEKLRGAGGQLAGQRWVVISATRWASEAPLKPTAAPVKVPAGGMADAPECSFPSVEFPESRGNRVSGNRTLRVSKHKGLQTQGSSNTTTPRARGAADVDKSDVVVSEEEQRALDWPAGLAKDHLASIRSLLLSKSWPGLANAQALLDELAGQLGVPGKVRNPPGLLRRLLERIKAGDFTLEHGMAVRQAREGKLREAERLAAAKAAAAPAPQAGHGHQVTGVSEAARRERERQLEKFPELAKRKAAKAAAHP